MRATSATGFQFCAIATDGTTEASPWYTSREDGDAWLVALQAEWPSRGYRALAVASC